MKAALCDTNHMFVYYPGIKGPEWPEEIKRKFKQDWGPDKDPWENWMWIEVHGTTFSGHSIRTTLGNTLRSLCYVWYYIKMSGVSEKPWNDERFFGMAAGDDVVL